MFTYTIADIIERYLKCVYEDGGLLPTRLLGARRHLYSLGSWL